VMGLYLDDCDSGEIVYGNVFEKAGSAVFVGGGRWNAVSNNLFVGCVSGIHLDMRGVSRAKPGSGLKNGWDLLAKLEEMKFRDSPWRERYPWLLNVMDDEPLLPLHNVFVGNVSVGTKMFMHLSREVSEAVMGRLEIRGNVCVGERTERERVFFPRSAAARVSFCEDAALTKSAESRSALELIRTPAFGRRFPDWPVSEVVK